MTIKTFYLLFIFNYCIFEIYLFKCHSDLKVLDLSINLNESNNSTYNNVYLNNDNRFLTNYNSSLSDDYQPIRIHIDYSNIKSYLKVSTSWLQNVKTIINNSIYIWQSILKVRRISNKLKVSDCRSNNLVIPNYIKYEGVDADLIIFVTIEDTNSNKIEAWASACSLSSINYRPVAGLLSLSKELVNFTKFNAIEYFTYLIVHEFTHIFVMSPSLFKYFWDETNNKIRNISEILEENVIVNNKLRSIIKSPKVLELAKLHFNCNDIKGIELENQGGMGTVGGHWESRIMLGDYMVAMSYEDIAISDITLGLFEDSGWYKVEYITGGLFKFGLNAGCNFFDSKCIDNTHKDNKTISSSTSKYFCDNNSEPLCMSGNYYKGICNIKSNIIDNTDIDYNYFNDFNLGGLKFADYCPVPISLKYEDYYYGGSCAYGKKNTLSFSLNENISFNSGCFIYNNFNGVINTKGVKNSVCYEYNCIENNETIQVIIKDFKLICSKDNEIIKLPNNQGELTCPNYREYCLSSIKCYDILDCVKKKSKRVRYSKEKSNKNVLDSYDIEVSSSSELDNLANNFQNSVVFSYWHIILIVVGILLIIITVLVFLYFKNKKKALNKEANICATSNYENINNINTLFSTPNLKGPTVLAKDQALNVEIELNINSNEKKINNFDNKELSNIKIKRKKSLTSKYVLLYKINKLLSNKKLDINKYIDKDGNEVNNIKSKNKYKSENLSAINILRNLHVLPQLSNNNIVNININQMKDTNI